jgi:glycosyltransferase involved in cell wall biosynthesis
MKILLVGEFSGISTGYGKITKELASRLYRDGYEVAELATFCQKDDPKIKNIPWKIYPNLPSTDEENREYQSNPQNSNGKWKFEETLLDFKPDYVFGNGDPFFYEYQCHSPFRKFFNWIIVAPVDGIPQHNQWIQFFENADGLMTYTDWGKNILEGYNLKVDGVFCPVASCDFFPIHKIEIDKFKNILGFSNKKIIGTIMRNQPRKLFDPLFATFSEYLKLNSETLLYCHTTYPDAGWDIPELLIKHNIIHKVLFTYRCHHCKESYPAYFQDIRSTCPFCKQLAAKMPDGSGSIDDKTLNKIINLFDVYVQLASREGLGIPQVEACACDVPVVTMNYAGMSDIANKIGNPVKIKDFYLSYPMNMMEALPDKKDLIKVISSVINIKKEGKNRTKYEKHYESWDKSYNVFLNIIQSLPKKSWTKQQINNPVDYQELDIPTDEYVKFLILYVLQEPSLIGSYFMTRLINDLNSGITFGGICGNYFTESIEQRNYSPFSRKDAYNICYNKKMVDNNWLSQI